MAPRLTASTGWKDRLRSAAVQLVLKAAGEDASAVTCAGALSAAGPVPGCPLPVCSQQGLFQPGA